MSAKNIDDQDFENQPSEVTDSSYDETYEDDVTYTEDDSSEWSDDVELTDEEELQDEEPPAPQKKKTSNLTIAIIVVVAIIGVFGFMILTGNQDGANQSGAEAQQGAVTIDADAEQDNISDFKQQADQSAQGDQTANISQPTAEPAPAIPQQGLMENPQLAASNTDAAPLPMADTNTLTAPADLGSAPAQDVVTAISPTVKPVSDFPTVDSIKKPDAEPVAVAPAPVVTEVTPILPIPNDTPAKPDQSVQLQAQVDAAQQKIALLEKQVADQASALAAQKTAVAKAAAVSAGSSEAEVDALKDKIADLEEKLEAKIETASTKAAVKSVVTERAAVEDNSYSSNEPVVKKAPAIVKPKVVAKQSWSLKSAGAGKAILSDKATGDLKTVRVGDVVSGLGRIVSISNSQSAWVVKGTSGSVSE